MNSFLALQMGKLRPKEGKPPAQSFMFSQWPRVGLIIIITIASVLAAATGGCQLQASPWAKVSDSTCSFHPHDSRQGCTLLPSPL